MSFFSNTVQKYAALRKGTGATTADDLKTKSQIIYPNNLLSDEGDTHFILFNINTLAASMYQNSAKKIKTSSGDITASNTKSPTMYSRGYTIQAQLKGGDGRYIRSNESIALAMPNSVGTTYGVDWNAQELGMAGKLARTVATYDQLTLEDVANALGEGLKNMATGAMETLTGFDAKQTAELYTGTIQNPFLEVLFKGVRTRDMSFEFTFMPRNLDEARKVAEIIRRFKFHAHPEFKYKKNDSSYFRYPSTFDITFMWLDHGKASRNQWLHRVNTCALVGIDIDEAPGGVFVTHDDGSMPVRKMRLNFVELTPLRKSDFENAEDTY